MGEWDEYGGDMNTTESFDGVEDPLSDFSESIDVCDTLDDAGDFSVSESVEMTEPSSYVYGVMNSGEGGELEFNINDPPKVLKRDITPEIIESRVNDTEKTLDNYRDNLRYYSVDEASIESFIDGERIKINEEFDALDQGITDEHIYKMPTDWEAVADSLKNIEPINEAGEVVSEVSGINDIMDTETAEPVRFEDDVILESDYIQNQLENKPETVEAAEQYEARPNSEQKIILEDGSIDTIAHIQEQLENEPENIETDLSIIEANEIKDFNEIDGWLKEINPNFDPFDIESPYCNNCGSCAYAVYQRLEKNTEICALDENIPFNKDMEALTGMEQVSMRPEEIEERLLEQGNGAHAIIGIDREKGPGHWFNAACIDGKVVAIDGQTGEIKDWPPDYGNVINWEMSVKREV